jgi:hypothetical protein
MLLGLILSRVNLFRRSLSTKLARVGVRPGYWPGQMWGSLILVSDS